MYRNSAISALREISEKTEQVYFSSTKMKNSKPMRRANRKTTRKKANIINYIKKGFLSRALKKVILNKGYYTKYLFQAICDSNFPSDIRPAMYYDYGVKINCTKKRFSKQGIAITAPVPIKAAINLEKK